MSEIIQPSKCVQRSWLLQTCVISVAVMSITLNLTLFILAQVHCMLALAAAYSFLAHPHWINACLMMVLQIRSPQDDDVPHVLSIVAVCHICLDIKLTANFSRSNHQELVLICLAILK